MTQLFAGPHSIIHSFKTQWSGVVVGKGLERKHFPKEGSAGAKIILETKFKVRLDHAGVVLLVSCENQKIGF